MHEAKGVAEFVQNDAFLACSDVSRAAANPAQVHRGFIGFDESDFIPNVGPRTRGGVKGDANGSLSSGDKSEFNIGVLFPLLNDCFYFVLLNSVAGLWGHEGVGEGL